MITCLLCQKDLNVLKHTHFKFNCTGQVRSVSEYRSLFPGAPTMSPEVSAKLSHSLDSFTKRYGDEEGSRKWKAYRNKMSSKNTFGAFAERRGWTHDEWSDYNKRRAVTLANLVAKYGEEEGTKRWNTYCEKQRTAGNTIEYFIEKLGEVAGPIKYAEVCKAKGITLENMIRVHGRDAGVARYHSWLEATNGNYVSLSASQFVKDVVNMLPNDTIFHEGVFGKEFCIWEDRVYMFDLVITSPVKKVVEFNGDFWHASPLKYGPDDVVKHRGGSKIAKDIWEADERKIQAIRKRGFEVLTVWESEYVADMVGTADRVVTWIMS
jgi:hypothetical protein